MNKILLIFLFLILLTGISFADELSVPFSCWPHELQLEFEKYDRKLDLSPNDRDEKSWGYVVSKGSSYVIYTYTPATKEDFETVMTITFEIEMRHKNG